MKIFLTLSLLLLSVACTEWLSGVYTGMSDSEDVYESSHPSDEYTDSDPSDSYGICWQQSYARYDYPLATKCDEGLVQIGAYCYQPCKEGYVQGYFTGLESETDIDPELSETTSDVESYCWETCPKGYEIWGNACKKDDVQIQLKSYNRSYVQALECAPGLEYYYGSCYDPARDGFTCQGSICYGKCPKGWGECGSLCTKKGLCVGQVLDEGFDVSVYLATDAYNLKDPSQGDSVNATSIPGVLNGTLYPWCH